VGCDGWLNANNPFKRGGANIEEKKQDEIGNIGFINRKGGTK